MFPESESDVIIRVCPRTWPQVRGCERKALPEEGCSPLPGHTGFHLRAADGFPLLLIWNLPSFRFASTSVSNIPSVLGPVWGPENRRRAWRAQHLSAPGCTQTASAPVHTRGMRRRASRAGVSAFGPEG